MSVSAVLDTFSYVDLSPTAYLVQFNKDSEIAY